MKNVNNSGYTLVEIILAIAILGLVLVPVFTYMINSSGLITYADEREMALIVAQQRMEYVKQLGYDNINVYSTHTLISNIDVDTENFPIYNSRYPSYNIYQKVEKIPDERVKIISIKVTWDNDNRVVYLNSKITDR